MSSTHDVLIAGTGPVGLFLACELRLRGLAVLVLEQAQDPRSPLKRLPFGLRGLSMPTIEAFHRRGLLDAIAASTVNERGAAAHWSNQARRPGGHFAGIQFFRDKIDPSAWRYRVPDAASPPLPVELEHVESVLAEHAAEMGAEIRRGVGVDSLEQSGESVTVNAGGVLFHGRWLIGCDGGRSTVRRAAGFQFVGTASEFTGYSAAIELADPAMLHPGRHHTPTGMYTFAPPGTIAMVDFDGGACHRIQPITLDHVQAVLRRVSGMDITVTALHLATTWTDRASQTTAYRNGRVLLAGDAAHIHSPLGGQGLNLGLGDAMNLGWKLAATVCDAVSDGLIDSYARERQPVGAQVLDWSRAQVTLMRPDRGTRALEAIVRDLVETGDGATYFASRLWGLSLRYDLGSEHPLVGRSAPELELADGTRLGEQLSTGKGLLLDLDAVEPLRGLARRWGDRISYVASNASHRLGASALLVRPDGFVAWAGDTSRGLAELDDTASKWFGRPNGPLSRDVSALPNEP